MSVNRAESPPSASKIEKDTADRVSTGPRETVVQQPEQLVGLEDRLLARA